MCLTPPSVFGGPWEVSHHRTSPARSRARCRTSSPHHAARLAATEQSRDGYGDQRGRHRSSVKDQGTHIRWRLPAETAQDGFNQGVHKLGNSGQPQPPLLAHIPKRLLRSRVDALPSLDRPYSAALRDPEPDERHATAQKCQDQSLPKCQRSMIHKCQRCPEA